MLKDNIKNNLTQAQKERDELKVSTLRMLLSAIKYFEIAKKGTSYQATEAEIIDVIGKEAKKRKEAIELYQKGNRPELAEKEAKELAILQRYLPEQLDEEELKRIVEEAVKQIGALSPKDTGKVMGVVMPKVKGRADGKRVSDILNTLLQ